jgi:hypothetical protein
MEYNEESHTLTINYDFNEELINIPHNTKIIIFEDNEYYKYYKYSKFNQKVDNLPNSLTHLTFGHYFNQKIDNLPKNLTHLTFGHLKNNEVSFIIFEMHQPNRRLVILF